MSKERNWVAKNDFNRSSVVPDKKKEQKKGVRKNKHRKDLRYAE